METFFQPITNFIFDIFYQLSLSNNPVYSAFILFINGLWVPFVFISIGTFLTIWKNWRQTIFHIKNRKFILLAIDVPRDNEQSPKAVENIFTHLHGILPGRNTIYQEWWLGKTTDYVSVELISIEGYVQFLVYTQPEYRDMVESAFYSQYPDAEITQVEDYVYGQNGEFKNLRFPNDKYELYGCEFILAKSFVYPIKLYPEFEHSLSQEFKDPMASLLENLNKIGKGEQMWFQIVITPEHDEAWRGKSNETAMKIAGKKTESKESFVDQSINSLLAWLDAFGEAVFPFYGTNPDQKDQKKEDLPSLMLHLTPAEQRQIEGIQIKADKHAFWCKFRYMYIADKKIATKARGISPISGSMKQFDSMNMNALKPHKYTKTWSLYYFDVKRRIARRQNNFLRAYQDRSRSDGSNGIILNTEELATIYHFPTEMVKAPLVSKTKSKRASAPISLPIQGAPRTLRESIDTPIEQKKEEITQAIGQNHQTEARPKKAQAPENLPFV